MKKLFILGLLLLTGYIKGQSFLNNSFESWNTVGAYSNDTVPSQWWTMYCNTSHQTTDASHGTYATRLQSFFACGIAQGQMINGVNPGNWDVMSGGTPWTTKPPSIAGYYKFTGAMTGDSAEVTVIFKKYNHITQHRDTVAFGYAALAPTNFYSVYYVSIQDVMPGVDPDSIVVFFNSSKYNLVDWAGTAELPNLYIDKMFLNSDITGIADEASSSNSMVYPNPFSDITRIELENGFTDNCILKIYDAEGREVPAETERQNSAMIIHKGDLGRGIYFYSIVEGAEIRSKGRFIIQ
jgi:hypothetical protein